MKILINCSNLKKGGGIQVAHSFLNEISQKIGHKYYTVLSDILQEEIDTSQFSNAFHFYHYSLKPSLKNALSGRVSFLDKLEKRICPDAVFTIFGPSYWRPAAKHFCGFAKAQYIYKDSPFFKTCSIKQRLFISVKEILHLHSFRNCADVYITESDDVSARLRSLMGAKPVFTINNTYNQLFDNIYLWDHSIKLEPFDGITLLTVSANYTHKNLCIIPKVTDYLQKTYPDFKFRFVLTLKESDMPKMAECYKRNIVFLGKVNINMCPPLYDQADLIFLPTLLECFSASYPEAMKMGIPILTSELPFAIGICNDAACYFNPLCPRDIGEKIFGLASSVIHRRELTEKGYQRLKCFNTPRSRAEKYLKIITNQTDHQT